MTLEAWHRMLAELGAHPDRDCFDRLVAAYGEGHRAYHTATHVDSCLRLLEQFRDLASHPAEVECALWFHDAVYSALSSKNEARSAEWAADFLRAVGVAGEPAQRIADHILATRHAVAPDDPDSQLVVDIDLSILGGPTDQYRNFEAGVRREYRWVPGPLYRRRRLGMLQSFLDRPRIYLRPQLMERFEAPARANLHSAIRGLRAR